ncbi:MAG: hypothetical protein PUC00_02255 [Clostridiales bacterium]|nr:hypothetical protein [Clostridiales bacterium]
MNGLPQAFVERMAAQLGDELPAFLRTFEEPYHRGIRLNPIKPVEAAQLPEGLMEPIPWERTGYYLAPSSKAGADILHEAGAWYLQEPSAMIPAAVLDVQPGEHVLDLCAAPGGKTTQSALRMAGQGTIVCNEPIRDRARILSRNVERMGVTNALVVSAWPEELSAMWPGAFDAIQCDAPCSGEGMFRRHPETREEWNAEAPAGCAKRQGDILDSAAMMLRPGGRLVYSTCTLNRIENEGVVESFLRRHEDFELTPFHLPGLSAPGGMLTVYPHRVKGEGHFVAKLRRKGEGSVTPWHIPALPRKEQQLLGLVQLGLPEGHGANWLRMVSSDGRGDEIELRRIPELPLGGLPMVLRCGVHLGTLRISRNAKAKPVFTPDHAWAVSGLPPHVPRVALTQDEARRYQHGDTVETDAQGWVLACYAGLPLGWGKASGGVMKNHYPKGLRR